MRYFHICKIMFLLSFIGITTVHAEDTIKRNPTLEEMSAAELKEALKKSHAEIESRLGSSGPASQFEEASTASKEKISSLSEKRAYESSAQSRINLLSYKIQTLETSQRDNWGYNQMDARKIRDIQSRASEQLIKIRSNNTEGWKTNKQALDSLLRQVADF